MKINIDDPRITQYALGEMPEEEIAAFENDIKDNPEIEKEIEDIRNFSTLLSDGFAADPELKLSDDRKADLHKGAKFADSEANCEVRRFPWRMVNSIAALFMLGFIVLFMVKNQKLTENDNKLSPVSPAKFAKVKSDQVNSAEPLMTREEADKINWGEEEEKDVEVADIQIEVPEKEMGIEVAVEDISVRDSAKVEMPSPLNMKISNSGLRLKKRKSISAKMRSNEYGSNLPVYGCAQLRREGELRPSVKSEDIDCDELVVMEKCRIVSPNTESYSQIVENAFKRVPGNELSTFSIDVDTASYANMRRFLNQGQLPPADSVRIEEFINYFSYEYPQPAEGKPFGVNFEMASCPWAPKHKLVKIGLKGRDIAEDKRPAGNLVFLLDVSGSMSDDNKLPLLKKSMKLMVENLNGNDRVAIVVYAGASGVVLNSTSADKKDTILSALERLNSGGSTNGGAGIELAYKIASENFIKGGINRVILATDGDFNVGTVDEESLEKLIEKKAKSGVFLTVLGFGMGNYKDSTLEKLSGKGNGNYAYIDTLNEAKKVLVKEMGATLVTIAKDVKIQVEFNPGVVEGYRLIGYENRMLKKEDFNDDKKDAGEIGAGHTVTAFYEIIPKGVAMPNPTVDPLKYKRVKKVAKVAEKINPEFKNELMTVKLRYKDPAGSKSRLLTFPLKNSTREYRSASDDFKFAASVAAFGMILRNSQYKGSANYKNILDLAENGLRNDKYGYRKQFLELIRKAQRIDTK
jgi:Ca-activated chloride channel family protein